MSETRYNNQTMGSQPFSSMLIPLYLNSPLLDLWVKCRDNILVVAFISCGKLELLDDI